MERFENFLVLKLVFLSVVNGMRLSEMKIRMLERCLCRSEFLLRGVSYLFCIGVVKRPELL